MKHSDWLRLQSEGESLCATLRQYNYQCCKQTKRLSWKLGKEDQDDYILAWLPAPISDWTLMPNDASSQRQQLWQLIEHTLALPLVRGGSKISSFPNNQSFSLHSPLNKGG